MNRGGSERESGSLFRATAFECDREDDACGSINCAIDGGSGLCEHVTFPPNCCLNPERQERGFTQSEANTISVTL